jgi:ABC-type multidrug transport system ATPase subunit
VAGHDWKVVDGGVIIATADFDPSCREHLFIYGRTKGVPLHLIDGVVDAMLKQMALWNYRDKLAGDYSGGNKRKLSVAIALLGDPKVLYLDEPSTGMDAHSRRYAMHPLRIFMVSLNFILKVHVGFDFAASEESSSEYFCRARGQRICSGVIY